MLKPALSEDPAFPATGPHASKGFLLGLLVGALALGCVWGFVGRPGPSSTRSSVSSPDGDLEVSYMVQQDASTAIGETLTGVTSIEFYPGYIVVVTKNGAGRTFFAERTNKLDWKWSDRAASVRSSH